jgi:hypothetical protein
MCFSQRREAAKEFYDAWKIPLCSSSNFFSSCSRDFKRLDSNIVALVHSRAGSPFPDREKKRYFLTPQFYCCFFRRGHVITIYNIAMFKSIHYGNAGHAAIITWVRCLNFISLSIYCIQSLIELSTSNCCFRGEQLMSDEIIDEIINICINFVLFFGVLKLIFNVRYRSELYAVEDLTN